MSGAMRARRCLLLAFFAYILLDLGCPFVPGAFTFDPAQSVDAVSASRLRPSARELASALPPRVVAAPFAITMPFVGAAEGSLEAAARVPAPARWRPHATRERVGAADPSPSTDDD